METLLVVTLVALTATFSYAAGARKGKQVGHTAGIIHGKIIAEMEHAILGAEAELEKDHPDFDSLEVEERHDLILKRVNEIIKEKFSE